MEDEIIIKGDFIVEGLGTKNIRQPLKYLKLKLTKIPLIQVEEFTSMEKSKQILLAKHTYKGKTMNIIQEEPSPKPCPICKGKGGWYYPETENTNADAEECSDCKGTGKASDD